MQSELCETKQVKTLTKLIKIIAMAQYLICKMCFLSQKTFDLLCEALKK